MRNAIFEREYKYIFLLKANAIISYNNRPASEAVPYFEQVSFLYLTFETWDDFSETFIVVILKRYGVMFSSVIASLT